jgi:dUTP pyrophosphatase
MRDFLIVDDQYLLADMTYVPKPSRSSKWSAGYDISTTLHFCLRPGEEITIPTGYKVILQPNEFLAIYPRSGSGFKYYARLANTTGIIDADYANNPTTGGQIFVKIRNESADKMFEAAVGDRVCQGVIQEYKLIDGDSLDFGDDRVGGLGSSGS